jgi:hypothetical protein
MDEPKETKASHIGELLKNFQYRKAEENTKVLYPRQELMKKFVDRLNAERDPLHFKPLSPAFIATKIYDAGLKTDRQLNWFYGYCNEAKQFSKCWWWSLSPHKEENKSYPQ